MLPLVLISSALAGLPLKSSRYDVTVTGPYADVEIEQVFQNDSSEWIAATYVVPLHHEGAVDAMSMVIRDVEIVAVLKEREAARQEYEQAVENGQAAALIEQERANVFTQRVGNIPPGEDIVVRLHVVQPVDRISGGYEVALPLVVGPRFVPDGVPDAAAVTPVVSASPTGHTVDVSVVVDAGLDLATLESPSHPDALVDVDGGVFDLVGARPTRDVVVRWTHPVDQPVASAVRQGDHLLVTFEPPEVPRRDQVVPRELVWVIDTSCSQEGLPLDMAKAAMFAAFDGMDAKDSFHLVQFDDEMRTFSPGPVPATPAALDQARSWVSALTAQGGTNMISGVYGALDLPADPRRQRYVVFLTDGLIGNEPEVLAAVEDAKGDAKVFSFGLGSSVNRWLVDELARAGGGQSTVVTLDESPEVAVDAFLDTIGKPVLSDVTIDWGGMAVSGVDPGPIPDLFPGEPLVLLAEVTGPSRDVVVRGRVGGGEWSQHIRVETAEHADAHAVRSVWARRRIESLERQQWWGEIDEVKAEILATSLEHGVMSRYTSFVAVQRQVIRHDAPVRDVHQPSEIPDGVSFETTVSRPYTPPGDPLLTVTAPSDARSVVASFPWGEVAILRWDPLRERWFYRFLVPRDVPEGEIEVTVWVVDAEGRTERRVERIVVDGSAPEIDGELQILDGRTRVVVVAEEPLRSLRIYAGGRELAYENYGLFDDAWEHVIEIPGEHDVVEVVAKDRAMNTFRGVIR
jgi:Ca-activated chloride channel family protein